MRAEIGQGDEKFIHFVIDKGTIGDRSMDKRVLIVLIIPLLFSLPLAGCGEKDTTKTTYLEVPGNLDPSSDWATSDWADSDSPSVDTSIRLGVNSSEMVRSITVTVSFEDSDPEHAETDDGSDPDDVQIQLSNGKNTSKAAIGTTPCTLTVDMMAPEGEFITGTWELLITASCNGGKKATLVPRPGVIPGPFVYKDQGVAYSLTGNYTQVVEKTE